MTLKDILWVVGGFLIGAVLTLLFNVLMDAT
jgi:hypothetical protein